MHVTIENFFCPYCDEVTEIYFRIINTILFQVTKANCVQALKTWNKKSPLRSILHTATVLIMFGSANVGRVTKIESSGIGSWLPGSDKNASIPAKMEDKAISAGFFSADECYCTRLSFVTRLTTFSFLFWLRLSLLYQTFIRTRTLLPVVDKAGFCHFPFAFILTPLSGRIETTIQIRLRPSFAGTFSSSPLRSVSLANSISSIAASSKIPPMLSSFQRFSRPPAGTGNSYVCGRTGLWHT